MKIIALDLGQKTGWATGFGKGESGVALFRHKVGDSPDIRFLMFRSWLKNKIEAEGIELIVFEKLFMRGGASSDFLRGMLYVMRIVAVETGVSYVGVAALSLKKFATGSGRASKFDMILTAEQRYGRIEDDNHADALHLRAWGEQYVNTTTKGNNKVSKGESTSV